MRLGSEDGDTGSDRCNKQVHGERGREREGYVLRIG